MKKINYQLVVIVCVLLISVLVINANTSVFDGLFIVDGKIGAKEYCDIEGSNCFNYTNFSNSNGGWVHSGSLVYNSNVPFEWEDLDLSNYVGIKSTMVMLKVKDTAPVSESYHSYWFRTKGDTEELGAHTGYDYGTSGLFLQPNSISYVILETDKNGVIQFRSKGIWSNALAEITLVGFIGNTNNNLKNTKISNCSIITESSFKDSSGNEVTVSSTCPDDKFLTGGGFQVTYSSVTFGTNTPSYLPCTSYPKGSNQFNVVESNSWEVYCPSGNPANPGDRYYIMSYAICCD
jgi:hypothetical protein